MMYHSHGCLETVSCEAFVADRRTAPPTCWCTSSPPRWWWRLPARGWAEVAYLVSPLIGSHSKIALMAGWVLVLRSCSTCARSTHRQEVQKHCLTSRLSPVCLIRKTSSESSPGGSTLKRSFPSSSTQHTLWKLGWRETSLSTLKVSIMISSTKSEESWFRVRGEPMFHRTNSTIFKYSLEKP